jgi:hypothetical protein
MRNMFKSFFLEYRVSCVLCHLKCSKDVKPKKLISVNLRDKRQRDLNVKMRGM